MDRNIFSLFCSLTENCPTKNQSAQEAPLELLPKNHEWQISKLESLAIAVVTAYQAENQAESRLKTYESLYYHECSYY